MSSTEYALDVVTRHQIFVDRFASGQVKEALAVIVEMNREIQAEIMSAKTLGSAQIASAKLEEINTIIESRFGVFEKELASDMKGFAANEADFYTRVIDKTATATATIPAKSILDEVIKRPMALLHGQSDESLSMQGAITQFSRKKQIQINRAITFGVVEGKTNREIAAVVNKLVSTRTLNQAEALVRTTVHHVAGEARNATSQENLDIVSHELWDSVLDSRTTITCASLDGKTFPVNSGPQTPRHWNCRSARVPVVHKDLQVTGLTGTRASESGQVSGKSTYGGWLRKQPSDVQNEVLGKDRAKLFRSGGLSVGKFTDDTGHVYSLEQLSATNPLAFQKADLSIN